jgi:hypothetical protein
MDDIMSKFAIGVAIVVLAASLAACPFRKLYPGWIRVNG